IGQKISNISTTKSSPPPPPTTTTTTKSSPPLPVTEQTIGGPVSIFILSDLALKSNLNPQLHQPPATAQSPATTSEYLHCPFQP
ncbi:unnamed protein product, partial [Ilex paraguariensis]